ncbi:hypothetical protein ACFX15_033579 [Malus domestica]
MNQAPTEVKNSEMMSPKLPILTNLHQATNDNGFTAQTHHRRPILILLAASLCRALPSSEDPVPAPWPYQFQLIDLWYDWPNDRNFNIIRHQLGSIAYDLEWNNDTSFFYTLDSIRECIIVQVEKRKRGWSAEMIVGAY